MADPIRLLILGGTTEAADLARHVAADPRLAVTTSLAGRTRNPASIPGGVRSGGFGGVAGLAHYIKDESIDLVVDATHPYAATMTANAAAAATETGVPCLHLLRPAWTAQAGDQWITVADGTAAAEALAGLGTRVFLTLGHRDLAAFGDMPEHWFLIRLIDPPKTPPPLANYELRLQRGPFSIADETALLRDHCIDVVVSKNSGGAATYAKIEAARDLSLPVVMIARPDPPTGTVVESVTDALAWIEAQMDSRQALTK